MEIKIFFSGPHLFEDRCNIITGSSLYNSVFILKKKRLLLQQKMLNEEEQQQLIRKRLQVMAYKLQSLGQVAFYGQF